MSGAAMAWHDLVLYLIERYVGAASAQSIARFFAMRWHDDGQSPYIGFAPSTAHGDAAVADAQAWLERNFSVASPVDEMVSRSGVPERTFKRRFTQATGMPPLDYVQRLRVELAKRRLEQSDTAIEEVAWAVGYEDPASFRKLFRRVTGVAPGIYRRRYRVPGPAARAALTARREAAQPLSESA
jgi:transcriptional regulator GlxA family with amidase domain